jgi:4-hydroxy-4-methyl-2-oxoglutarate aldolase
LLEIGFPVFSCGAFPAGPARLDLRESGALQSVALGSAEASRDDVALGDDDGVLFVAAARIDEVLTTARGI